MRFIRYELKESHLKNTIKGSLTNVLKNGNGASLSHLAGYTGEICPNIDGDWVDLFTDWALQNDLCVVVFAPSTYALINGDEVDLTIIERSGDRIDFSFSDAAYKKVHQYNNSIHIAELLEGDIGVYSSLMCDQVDDFESYRFHMESPFRVIAVDKQNMRFYAPSLEPSKSVVDNSRTFRYSSDLISIPTNREIKEKWLTIAGGDIECPPVETKAVETNNPINKTEKVEIMSKVNAVVNVNKTALVTAAKLEAGKIGLKQMSKLVQPAIPMMLRGYADTAMGRVALANIFHFAASNYAGGNDKVKVVADAMLEAAMIEFVGSFNIEEIFEKVIGGIDVSKLTNIDD